jgi:outer membrane immunogenic protein
MHKVTFASAVLLIGGAVAFAGPEVVPSGKEMKEVATPPSCDYSWAGFYMGLNVGYGWGNADTDFDPLPQPGFGTVVTKTLHPDPDGIFGGGQIGFNWQWNRLILGIETDFQGSDIDGSETVPRIIDAAGFQLGEAHERINWFGTFRGRIGFSPFCRLMIYGTGGLAYGNVDYSATLMFIPTSGYLASVEDTKVGWTAGAGLEYAIARHWSVKVEYLFYDLGDKSATGFTVPPNPPFHVDYTWETQGNIVRGGFNFKF